MCTHLDVIYIYIYICLEANVLTCMDSYMLGWSHAPFLTCLDDHMLPCTYALSIICSHAMMIPCSHSHML